MKNLLFYILTCLLALYASPCFSEITTRTDKNTGKASMASVFTDDVIFDHALEGNRTAGETLFFKKDGSEDYLLRFSGTEDLTDATLDPSPRANIIIDSTIYAMPFHGSASSIETKRDSILTGYSEYLISREAVEKLAGAKAAWIELRPKLEAPLHWKIAPEMLAEWKKVLLKNSTASP